MTIRKSTSIESAKRFRDSYHRDKHRNLFKDACTKCQGGYHSRLDCQNLVPIVNVGTGRLLPTPQQWLYLERMFPGIYGDWIIFVAEPIENYVIRLGGSPMAPILKHKISHKSYAYRRSQWESL